MRGYSRSHERWESACLSGDLRSVIMRPAIIVFDVNETLSDLKPIADRFEEVGAGPELARTWFAGLLRDGFALTTTEEHPDFATLAAEALRVELTGVGISRDTEEATAYIMEGFASLSGHDDLVPGIDLLAGSGFRPVSYTHLRAHET